MIEEIINPTLKLSENIIKEAIKIMEEKEEEEYTEEDILIIKTAIELTKLVRERTK